MKIVFMGSPEFAAPTLEALLERDQIGRAHV
jgi:methionyl-tRNA formyltransferase